MDTGACPDRGLASFRQEDAGWFFGRARSTEALVEKLTGERGTGLIMLVGASGAGKSSLIAAGLLPALGEDVVPVTMTPRDDPVHELTNRIPELGPVTAAERREAIIGPAKSVGLQLEAGLADLIVRDVGAGTGRTRTGTIESVHDAGVLPLLSHALLATWQRRQPGSLTIEGYR